MPIIMVVDDDQDLAEMLGIVLTSEGFEVNLVSRGDEVISAFESQAPDLVLLDIMLPGINGVEVCKKLREKSMVPIVMLTAKGETVDVVAGLEAGADDYMVKPFKPQELVARLKVRLRRSGAVSSNGLRIGNIEIDQISHTILREGQTIPLTRLEFDLIVALAKEPGRVFTREALLSEVWGYRPATDTRLVNVHIQRLRAKVERDPEDPRIILTVRGVGYKAGVDS
jgi:two-component system, OmpR family, response regulator MtrA